MERGRWFVLGLIVAALPLAACQQAVGAERPNGPPTGKTNNPATVQRVPGTEFSRVTLTAKAAERLEIQTAPVREAAVTRSGNGGGMRKVIPYSAVLYDAQSDTWVYTNPEPLVFVRHRIRVDYIEGDVAVLSDGPPSGTKVVTAGAALLFSTEFEVGH
jgi:hypothetical protein